MGTINKEIYKKVLKKYKGITIWEVDGYLIRRDLDIAFTNFGQHFRYKYIPLNEIWIDIERNIDERNLFIQHAIKEWEFMNNGYDYVTTCYITDSFEQIERAMDKNFKSILKKNGQIDEHKLYKRRLGKTKDNINIMEVSGKIVRDYLRIEFVAGGHDLVYPFVPQNEVWIEDDIVEQEIPYIILHELYEREKMSCGMEYLKAHSLANNIEVKARKNFNILEESLIKLSFIPSKSFKVLK